jgi:2-polyprenyl-3-methyl-5-hydroxy-6-metoxy-1,4-benzoquinol methylase
MMATPHNSAMSSWNTNADCWDQGVGQEGNKYWRVLQLPSLKRLVEVNQGDKALELATGNGLVARWLAGAGATVLATDGSENMLEHAIRRTPPEQADQIVYQQLDVTDPAAFEALLQNPLAVRSLERCVQQFSCCFR